MKNEIVKTDVNFDEVSKLNQFAKQNNISDKSFPIMYII